MKELDKAQRPGGLYYLADGTAVDAEGNKVEGAPERPENTPPSQQPGYDGPGAPQSLGGPVPTAGIMVTPEMLQQLVQAEIAKATEPAASRGGK